MNGGQRIKGTCYVYCHVVFTIQYFVRKVVTGKGILSRCTIIFRGPFVYAGFFFGSGHLLYFSSFLDARVFFFSFFFFSLQDFFFWLPSSHPLLF